MEEIAGGGQSLGGFHQVELSSRFTVSRPAFVLAGQPEHICRRCSTQTGSGRQSRERRECRRRVGTDGARCGGGLQSSVSADHCSVVAELSTGTGDH